MIVAARMPKELVARYRAAWRAMYGIAQSSTGTAGQLLNDGARRIQYWASSAKLSGPDAGAVRSQLARETYPELTAIGKAVTDAAKPSRVGQLDLKTGAELLESAPRTSGFYDGLGVASATVDAVGVAAGVAAVVVDVENAPAGQKLQGGRLVVYA